MVVTKETQSNLRRLFNLNLYEVKIWTALISQGSATAGELSDISNVPRSRTYDILQSLEKRGFILMQVGKPIRYSAIAPFEVVERVKAATLRDAEEKTKSLEKLKQKGNSIIAELEVLFKKGIEHVEPHSLSGALRGRNNINSYLSMLIKNAEKTVVIATTKTGILREASALSPALKAAKKKGVAVKFAAPIDKPVEALKGFSDCFKSDMSTRFVVVDGKHVVLMVSDDEKVHADFDSGIWISSPYIGKALETVFTKISH